MISTTSLLLFGALVAIAASYPLAEDCTKEFLHVTTETPEIFFSASSNLAGLNKVNVCNEGGWSPSESDVIPSITIGVLSDHEKITRFQRMFLHLSGVQKFTIHFSPDALAWQEAVSSVRKMSSEHYEVIFEGPVPEGQLLKITFNKTPTQFMEVKSLFVGACYTKVVTGDVLVQQLDDAIKSFSNESTAAIQNFNLISNGVLEDFANSSTNAIEDFNKDASDLLNSLKNESNINNSADDPLPDENTSTVENTAG